jgi:hypothetical protein
MEQRTSYHDTHNRLVTVFLRKLEYYQGIVLALAEADANQVSYMYLELAAELNKFRRTLVNKGLPKEYTSSSIPWKVMWIISFLDVVERFGSYCAISRTR